MAVVRRLFFSWNYVPRSFWWVCSSEVNDGGGGGLVTQQPNSQTREVSQEFTYTFAKLSLLGFPPHWSADDEPSHRHLDAMMQHHVGAAAAMQKKKTVRQKGSSACTNQWSKPHPECLSVSGLQGLTASCTVLAFVFMGLCWGVWFWRGESTSCKASNDYGTCFWLQIAGSSVCTTALLMVVHGVRCKVCPSAPDPRSRLALSGAWGQRIVGGEGGWVL